MLRVLAVLLVVGCGGETVSRLTITLVVDDELARPDFALVRWTSGVVSLPEMRAPVAGFFPRQGPELGTIVVDLDQTMTGRHRRFTNHLAPRPRRSSRSRSSISRHSRW